MAIKSFGSELRINTFTANDQDHPAIAIDSQGRFVVVWQSEDQDEEGEGIYGRVYRPGGAPNSAEFRVNTTQANDQTLPAVAMDAVGDFVVVWQSDGQDGSGQGIFAQRFTASGQLVGSEFRVTTTTSGDQENPAVTMDANGNFIVAWESEGPSDNTTLGQDNSGKGIFAQRFDANGTKIGREFRVNTTTDRNQSNPAIVTNASGAFVIAWESNQQDGKGQGIFAQRYSANGTPIGLEFQVNTKVDNDQSNPTVAIDAAGNFMIAWESEGQDGDGAGIYARRYSASGNPRSEEFRVNSETSGDQQDPTLGSDAEGNFTIAWSSQDQDGDGFGIYARRYRANGVADGNEFRVNSETDNDQTEAAIAVTGGGDLAITWASDDQDGDNQGVFAQQYEVGGSVSPGLEGDERNNKIRGTAQRDEIYGFGGNDTLWGLAGNDLLVGGTGRDHLYGSYGRDTLKGGGGRDTLDGGAGNDLLYGEGDNDRLTGKGGRDTFAIGAAAGTETITDFEDRSDRLGLLEGLKFSQLSISQRGKDVFVSFGTDLLAILKNQTVTMITTKDFVAL